jgi:hypothetical protein
MKRGIEAGDLGHRRLPASERLDQPDLSRKVIGRKHRVAAQLGEQSWRDPLRFGVSEAVYDAMANGTHGREDRLCFEPIDQKTGCCVVIGAGNASPPLSASAARVDRQRRVRRSNAIDLAGES